VRQGEHSDWLDATWQHHQRQRQADLIDYPLWVVN
jgi:hypothetical protein